MLYWEANKMVDFLKKTGQQILTSINKGLVGSGMDGNIDVLEIEAIHTKYNEDTFLIKIEPAELSISDNVSISMGGGATGYGRMDPIGNFTGTSRTMSISFVMIKSEVLNGVEAVSNNTLTANLLKQSLYPSYVKTQTQNTSVIKTPPYFRIKYGDLIGDFRKGGLTGFISNMSISNQSFEGIGDNLGFGINAVKIPIEYQVDFTFNVIHEHLVGWYDGKFADDGRVNWPFNSGINTNTTAGAPGFTGGNNTPTGQKAVPGSPDAVAAETATKRQ